jgi:hypothetical protein
VVLKLKEPGPKDPMPHGKGLISINNHESQKKKVEM